MAHRLRVCRIAAGCSRVTPAVRAPVCRRFQSTATPEPVPDTPAYTNSHEIPIADFLDRRPEILTTGESVSPNATSPYPSPPIEAALSSAKLHALHARLNLGDRFPIHTLARALVDSSADENPKFNNTNLAYLGGTVINYHLAEYLVCKYPRLPMLILYEVMRGFAGPDSLSDVAKAWGVESAREPGGEVDPGLLQFSRDTSKGVQLRSWGTQRKEAAFAEKYNWRRSVSSRTVLDDDFGDKVGVVPDPATAEKGKLPREIIEAQRKAWMDLRASAMGTFVKAVVGGLYIHRGREVAKAFVQNHLLTRSLPIDKMFAFRNPTYELSKLCAREGFEAPVARMESETGRHSRTPVFVVGIYSGTDKLGEGAGPSIDEGRIQATMNALKAWYLYSPGDNVRVPSDMFTEGAAPWTAPYVDVGEVV